jgi:hypothetical protein
MKHNSDGSISELRPVRTHSKQQDNLLDATYWPPQTVAELKNVLDAVID